MDTNLTFRDGGSAGALTATFTATKPWVLQLDKVMYAIITLPITATGTTPTLNAKAEFLKADNTVLETATIPQITTTKGVYQIPLTALNPLITQLKITLTIAGTNPDYGNVDVYVSPAPDGKTAT